MQFIKCNERLSIRSWSILVIMAFSLQEAAFAGPEVATLLQSQQAKPLPMVSVSEVIQDPSKFNVPFEHTTLKEFFPGSNGKLIIHIQDAHANYSGQMSMAKALDKMMSAYGQYLVLAEGASKDVTLTELKPLAKDSDWKIAARRFLQDSVIAGEEYLNLTSKHPMKIRGVEYRDLYDAALATYADLVGKRQDILNYLHRIQVSIERLKAKHYSEALLDYEKKVRNPQSETPDLTVQFDELLKLIGPAQVDLAGFQEVNKLKTLKDTEKNISFEKANLEQEKLLAELSSKGLKTQVDEYLAATKKTRNLQVSQSVLLGNLMDLAKSQSIDTASFVELSRYSEYLKFFSALDLEQVMKEVELLEDTVYKNLLPAEDGRKLRAVDRFVGLLNKAYRIKMSSHDFRTLAANKDDFKTEAWEAFLNDQLLKLSYFDDLVPLKPLLEEAAEPLFNFYKLVDQRDDAFLENTGRILEEENVQVGYLIAGGYHTENLTRLFKNEGYSVIVLTPVVEFETDQKLYEKMLLMPFILAQSEKEKEERKLAKAEDPDASRSTLGQTRMLQSPLSAKRAAGEMDRSGLPSEVLLLAARLAAEPKHENTKETVAEVLDKSLEQTAKDMVSSLVFDSLQMAEPLEYDPAKFAEDLKKVRRPDGARLAEAEALRAIMAGERFDRQGLPDEAVELAMKLHEKLTDETGRMDMALLSDLIGFMRLIADEYTANVYSIDMEAVVAAIANENNRIYASYPKELALMKRQKLIEISEFLESEPDIVFAEGPWRYPNFKYGVVRMLERAGRAAGLGQRSSTSGAPRYRKLVIDYLAKTGESAAFQEKVLKLYDRLDDLGQSGASFGLFRNTLTRFGYAAEKGDIQFELDYFEDRFRSDYLQDEEEENDEEDDDADREKDGVSRKSYAELLYEHQIELLNLFVSLTHDGTSPKKIIHLLNSSISYAENEQSATESGRFVSLSRLLALGAEFYGADRRLLLMPSYLLTEQHAYKWGVLRTIDGEAVRAGQHSTEVYATRWIPRGYFGLFPRRIKILKVGIDTSNFEVWGARMATTQDIKLSSWQGSSSMLKMPNGDIINLNKIDVKKSGVLKDGQLTDVPYISWKERDVVRISYGPNAINAKANTEYTETFLLTESNWKRSSSAFYTLPNGFIVNLNKISKESGLKEKGGAVKVEQYTLWQKGQTVVVRYTTEAVVGIKLTVNSESYFDQVEAVQGARMATESDAKASNELADKIMGITLDLENPWEQRLDAIYALIRGLSYVQIAGLLRAYRSHEQFTADDLRLATDRAIYDTWIGRRTEAAKVLMQAKYPAPEAEKISRIVSELVEVALSQKRLPLMEIVQEKLEGLNLRERKAVHTEYYSHSNDPEFQQNNAYYVFIERILRERAEPAMGELEGDLIAPIAPSDGSRLAAPIPFYAGLPMLQSVSGDPRVLMNQVNAHPDTKAFKQALVMAIKNGDSRFVKSMGIPLGENQTLPGRFEIVGQGKSRRLMYFADREDGYLVIYEANLPDEIDKVIAKAIDDKFDSMDDVINGLIKWVKTDNAARMATTQDIKLSSWQGSSSMLKMPNGDIINLNKIDVKKSGVLKDGQLTDVPYISWKERDVVRISYGPNAINAKANTEYTETFLLTESNWKRSSSAFYTLPNGFIVNLNKISKESGLKEKGGAVKVEQYTLWQKGQTVVVRYTTEAVVGIKLTVNSESYFDQVEAVQGARIAGMEGVIRFLDFLSVKFEAETVVEISDVGDLALTSALARRGANLRGASKSQLVKSFSPSVSGITDALGMPLSSGDAGTIRTTQAGGQAAFGIVGAGDQLGQHKTLARVISGMGDAEVPVLITVNGKTASTISAMSAKEWLEFFSLLETLVGGNIFVDIDGMGEKDTGHLAPENSRQGILTGAGQGELLRLGLGGATASDGLPDPLALLAYGVLLQTDPGTEVSLADRLERVLPGSTPDVLRAIRQLAEQRQKELVLSRPFKSLSQAEQFFEAYAIVRAAIVWAA